MSSRRIRFLAVASDTALSSHANGRSRHLKGGSCTWGLPKNRQALHRCLILLTWLSFLPLAAGEVAAWLNPELARLMRQEESWKAALLSLPASPKSLGHGQQAAGFHSSFASLPNAIRWVQVDLGSERPLDEVVLIPAVLGSSEAYGFPLRFRLDASSDPLFGESITLLDQTAADVRPSAAPWQIPAQKVRARYLRFTATRLTTRSEQNPRYLFCLGEMLVFSGGRNIALQAKVEAPNSVETLPTWSPRHLVDGSHGLGLPEQPTAVKSNGWHSAVSPHEDDAQWVEFDFGSIRELQEIRLIPAHPQDFPDRFGFGFPRRFKIEADGHMLIDQTTTDMPHPGDTTVAFQTSACQTRTLRITATKLWERSGDYVFALAEVQAISNGSNIAPESRVTSLEETVTPFWQREGLVDGHSSQGRLIDERRWLAGLSQRREIEQELDRMQPEKAAALRLAQTRAVQGGSIAGATLLLLGLAAFFRLEHVRHRELEALRQQLSRDLHDEIGSHLGSIRLMSELALREGEKSDSLEEIHRLAGEAAESMRGIVWLVRAGDEPTLMNLVEALRQSAAALLKGLDWQLQAPSQDDDAKATLAFHRQVFLLARETMHNISRHAGASQVKMEVSWQGRRFHLQIQDNGCGFDLEAIRAGDGLANLRQRAEMLHAKLDIHTARGQGTRIDLEADFS